MRIVQLGKYYPPHLGGIENNVWQCCHALAEEHEVTALVFNEKSVTTRERDGRVNVVRLRSWGKLSSQELCLTLGRELVRARPDIVHFHSPNPLAMTFYQFLTPKIPLVITHHTDMVRQKFLKKIFRPGYQRLLNRSAAVIAYTERYAQDCDELRGYRGRPVIIPNGTEVPPDLDDAEFLREARDYREKVSNGQSLVVFVGRLVAYKGLKVLIDAVERLPNLRLIIAGNGPEESALRTRISLSSANERIVLAGPVLGRDKWRLIKAGDFLVLPSLNMTESFGQVLVEAQLCGKATIVTDIPGGVNEVVIPGVTGLQVPAGDVEALVDAMKRLMVDQELRVRLGAAGHKRAHQYFTRAVTDDKLRTLFRKVSDGICCRAETGRNSGCVSD